jgi:hypothetical protein
MTESWAWFVATRLAAFESDQKIPTKYYQWTTSCHSERSENLRGAIPAAPAREKIHRFAEILVYLTSVLMVGIAKLNVGAVDGEI